MAFLPLFSHCLRLVPRYGTKIPKWYRKGVEVVSTSMNGVARRGLTGLLGRAPSPEPNTRGIPLSELLGRALAEASGEEYQPPKLSELKDLLGSENYELLVQNPKIKAGIRLWANDVSDDSRPKVIKNLAILIADEVGRSDLENRIAWEIRKLK